QDSICGLPVLRAPASATSPEALGIHVERSLDSVSRYPSRISGLGHNRSQTEVEKWGLDPIFGLWCVRQVLASEETGGCRWPLRRSAGSGMCCCAQVCCPIP